MSCDTPAAAEGYDCAGNCLVDTDGDGVCDADEVVGCQDASACNYNADATDAGSCNIPVGCDTCDGDNVVNNDADGDGVCDADEVVGCQDESASNYDANATDADDCEFAPCPAVNFSFVNTGVNMTLFVPDGIALTGQVGAFVGDMCIGSENYEGGALQIAVMGDDQDSPQVDGALEGDVVTLKLQNSNGVYVTELSFTYSTNGIEVIEETISFDFLCTGNHDVIGCMDGHYVEFNPSATINGDFDLCVTPAVYGCTDETACNYNSAANVDNGSCYNNDLGCGCDTPAAAEGLDCDGNCLADADGDGVCDADEVVGCQDEDASNYDANATDAGDCDYCDELVDAAYADGVASVDITTDNQGVADQAYGWGYGDGYGAGAACRHYFR